MYISEWIPPDVHHEGQTDLGDGGISRPLVALVIVMAIAVAGVLACDYVQARAACTASEGPAPC